MLSYTDYSLDNKSKDNLVTDFLPFLSPSSAFNSDQEIAIWLQQFWQGILKWETPAVIRRQSTDQQYGPEHVQKLFFH